MVGRGQVARQEVAGMTSVKIGSATGLILMAGPAGAECLGSCADAMVGALLAMLIYGVLGLVVLVMLIRQKWRRGGVKLLAAVALAAVGLPLLSQAWHAWKLRSMAGHEIAGPLPALDGKTVLLLTESRMACYYDLCSLLLADRGAAGAYVLTVDALERRETGKPIALADLPLELWHSPTDGAIEPQARPLTEAERATAAAGIDYLIVQPRPWNADLPEAAEAGLRQNPALSGLKAEERVNFAFGPVEDGKLDLSGMSFDLLDLWLDSRELALILAPYNTQDPGNSVAGSDGLIAALCADPAKLQNIDCDYALR